MVDQKSEVLGTMFDTGVETTDVYAKQDRCHDALFKFRINFTQ